MKAKRKVAALPWRTYLLVACVGVIISGMVGYGLRTEIQLDARHIPLHEATMQLMIDATTSHLLFEEIISGDRHEDIKEVWEYSRRAEQLMQFMLEGGEIPEGTIVPLDDEQMQRQIEDARRVLAEYCKVTRQRIIAFESSLPGTEIDQLTDSLFAAFMDKAENVEIQLHQLMAGELDRFHAVQITLIVVSFLLTLLVGLVLHRHIRRHIQDMQAIRLVKDDLEKDITERKQAEAALQESEERFRQIVERSSGVFYRQNINTVRFEYVSPKVIDLLGITPEGMKSMDLEEQKARIHPDDLPHLIDFSKDLVEADSSGIGFIEREFRIMHKSGEYKWVQGSYNLTRDANGEPEFIVGGLQDITERKQADEALRHNEENMRAILDAAPDVIHLLDADGIVISTNRGFARRVGKDVNEIVGRCIYDFHPPDSIPQRKAAVDRVFRTGEPIHIVDESTTGVYETHIHPVFDPEGKVNAIAVYARDITERMRAEEALRESEERYRAVFDSATEGILVADIETRKFLYVNPAICRMLGYSAKELINMGVENIHPKDDLEYVLTVFKAQAAGNQDLAIDIPCLRKNGEVIYADISVGCVTINGIPCSVGFFTDITERKRAEKLTQIQRDLAQTLSESRNLNEALSHCLTAALYATGMDAGGVYLVDQKAGSLDLAISTGLSPGFVASASHYNADSPSARLVMKGKPVYTLHHKMDVAVDKSLLQEGLRAIAVIPLSHEGKIIACLNIASHTLDDFPQAVRSMAETIVNQMGAAVARIQAEEALKQAHDQLELRVKERTEELSLTNEDLKREISVRERIEKKLREHQNELQTLASELSLAEERERRRFAANLHDTISQNLVMAHMKLESLTVDKLPDEVSVSIKQANQMVGEALESTQTLTFELSPPVLHRLGLGPAVESLGDRMHQLHGLKVELVNQGPTEPLTEDLGAFLFRATRELLINVVKHAKTEYVKVTVKKIRSTIQVEVEDQGVGFVHADPKVGRRHGEGFGLFSIQEHLTRLGGSLKIWSEPGQGTRIAMNAPLKTAGKTAEETRV